MAHQLRSISRGSHNPLLLPNKVNSLINLKIELENNVRNEIVSCYFYYRVGKRGLSNNCHLPIFI